MRVTITLQEEEKDALLVLAEQEKRDPRRQAALIIRQELERRGLLQCDAGDAHRPGLGVDDDHATNTGSLSACLCPAASICQRRRAAMPSTIPV